MLEKRGPECGEPYVEGNVSCSQPTLTPAFPLGLCQMFHGLVLSGA